MATRLTGIPSLSYMGVEASQPPNITFHSRAPLQSDYQNFNTGDIWVDTSKFPPNPPVAQDIYMLVSKKGRVGRWVSLGSGGIGNLNTLTGDTGGPVFGDAANNINIKSGIAGLVIDGTITANTLTLTSSGGGGLLQTLTAQDTNVVSPDGTGTINVVGAAGSGLTTTGATANTITIETTGGGAILQSLSADDSPPVVLPDVTGDIHLQGTAGNITTTQSAGTNSIIFNTGDTIASTYTADDTNTAVPISKNLNVFGINGITTSVPVPGGDVINIGGNGTLATSYATDSGTATPAAGVLNVVGGSNVTTSGAGNTVTINAIGGGNLNMFRAEVLLTSQQIKNIDVTPITIVPSPGAGKIVLVTTVYSSYYYGGNNTFVGNSSIMLLYNFITPAGPIVSFLTGDLSLKTFNTFFYGSISVATMDSTMADGLSLILKNISGNPISGNASNDNTLLIVIYYTIEDL